MRPLSLDFAPRRTRPAAIALLAVGLSLCLAAIAGTLWLHQQIDSRQRVLSHQQHQLDGGRSQRASLSPAEQREQAAQLAQMQELSGQLQRPWEQLFGMLESLPRDDVALLSLTPDARKGQLRISAEARDLEAMLRFHKALEASPDLHDVALQSHEITQAPEHPVQFNLSAQWEIAHARP